MINPQDLAPWASLAKDLLTALAAAVGAIVAILGLNTWRRQLRGHTEYELARRYLRAALRVRDAISTVRNPFMNYVDKTVPAKSTDAGPQAESLNRAESTRLAYADRWQRLDSARSDLRLEAIEAEVLWGSQALAVLEPLNRAIGELYSSLSSHLDRLDRPHFDGPSGWSQLDWNRINSVIYESSADPAVDQFTKTIVEAVRTIEGFLAPRLRN